MCCGVFSAISVVGRVVCIRVFVVGTNASIV